MIDPELRDDPALAVTNRVVLQFAALWFAVFAFGSVRALVFRGAPVRGLLLAAVALAVPAAALVRPGAVGTLFTILSALTRPIGMVVTQVLLAVTYFAVFTPLALLFRLARRDALVRRRPDHTATYWSKKEQPGEVANYLRQS